MEMIKIMINPPNSDQNSGSYVGLLNRIAQRVQKNNVDDQILNLGQQVFEEELNKENIVLSRPERARLLQQVTQAILTDILNKI